MCEVTAAFPPEHTFTFSSVFSVVLLVFQTDGSLVTSKDDCLTLFLSQLYDGLVCKSVSDLDAAFLPDAAFPPDDG